jgi:cellulose synthase (UDP-forming)
MQVRQLDSLCTRFYPEKPYLVSEFGPEGYWDEDYTDIDEFGHPKEPGDFAKAQNYIRHWRDYVLGNYERNIGGVAFCWKDRMEETITWFGLTDHKNRKKPSYYALQSEWTGIPFEFPMSEIYLSHPWQISGEVEIKLISTMLDSLPSNLTYEWSIREDDFLRPFQEFEVLSNGKKLRTNLSALREGRAYRAYLHLYNDKNQVVTATVPLLVNPSYDE